MREYPISLGYKAILYFFVLGLFAGTGVSLHHVVATADHDRLPTLLLAVFLTALGVYVIWEIRAALVTLDDYSLTERSAFSSKSILLKDIEGFREGEKGDFALVLTTGKKQQVPQFIARRDELIGYFKENYPDLDGLELEKNQEQLLDDERFGATIEEREDSLVKAKRLAMIANIAGVAISLWYIFYPIPYELTLALVLLAPLFALYWIWRSKGLIRFYSAKTSPYPSLGTMAGFPVGAVMLRALIAYNIYSFSSGSWMMLLGGSAILILLTLSSTREVFILETKKGLLIAGIILLSIAYCYGAMIITNCHFDRGRAQVWPVTVTGKHISKGKTTTYYVAVSPWGKYTEGKDVEVGKSFYQRVETGDAIRVVLKPGMLGIPWYYAVAD